MSSLSHLVQMEMSFCRWMYKQAVVYLYNDLLFSDKKYEW